MVSRLSASLLVALLVLGLLLAPVRADAALQEIVTARLGISAGDAIQDMPRGTAGRVLAERIPVLYDTASAYGVRIVTVSVGQGFWSEDGEVMAENDLDLVVSGTPENVNALAATLGMTWEQSVVLVWHGSSGPMATATIPLPGGTDGLTPDVYQALIAELVDGGHFKYAGANSLLFVARTGGEPDEEFYARMEHVRQILEAASVATGTVQVGSAEMVFLDSDTYEGYILPRAQGKAA